MSGTWAMWAALMVAGLLAVGCLAEKVTGLARTVVITAGLCALASPISRAVSPTHPGPLYLGTVTVIIVGAAVWQVRALRGAR